MSPVCSAPSTSLPGTSKPWIPVLEVPAAPSCPSPAPEATLHGGEAPRPFLPCPLCGCSGAKGAGLGGNPGCFPALGGAGALPPSLGLGSPILNGAVGLSEVQPWFLLIPSSPVWGVWSGCHMPQASPWTWIPRCRPGARDSPTGAGSVLGDCLPSRQPGALGPRCRRGRCGDGDKRGREPGCSLGPGRECWPAWLLPPHAVPITGTPQSRLIDEPFSIRSVTKEKCCALFQRPFLDLWDESRASVCHPERRARHGGARARLPDSAAESGWPPWRCTLRGCPSSLGGAHCRGCPSSPGGP